MSIFAPAAQDLALDALDIANLSLHSAYPGADGLSNELAGGSPAYARKAVTFAAAAAGVKSANNTPITFDIPAGADVAFLGMWAAGPAWRGYIPIGAGDYETFTALAADDLLRVPDHAFADGNQVVLVPAANEPLPTGLVEGTIYWVIAQAADQLQLSTTQGGAAIDITGDGTGFIKRIVPESFASQTTYNVDSVDLDARFA